jgi:hypothetical protein
MAAPCPEAVEVLISQPPSRGPSNADLRALLEPHNLKYFINLADQSY